MQKREAKPRERPERVQSSESRIAARPCLYVDHVPVLFDLGDVEPYRTWYAPLGARKRFGIWVGEYPLTGDLLEESMRLYREVVYDLIPMEHRRPLPPASMGGVGHA